MSAGLKTSYSPHEVGYRLRTYANFDNNFIIVILSEKCLVCFWKNTSKNCSKPTICIFDGYVTTEIIFIHIAILVWVWKQLPWSEIATSAGLSMNKQSDSITQTGFRIHI